MKYLLEMGNFPCQQVDAESMGQSRSSHFKEFVSIKGCNSACLMQKVFVCLGCLRLSPRQNHTV